MEIYFTYEHTYISENYFQKLTSCCFDGQVSNKDFKFQQNWKVSFVFSSTAYFTYSLKLVQMVNLDFVELWSYFCLCT